MWVKTEMMTRETMRLRQALAGKPSAARGQRQQSWRTYE